MATRIFRGQIEEGRFCLVDRADFAALKASLEGKPIELTLKRLRPARSTKANSYYWGVVLGTFAEHIGCTPQELHEDLKWRLLRKEDLTRPIFGNTPMISVKSTTQLDTREFAEFIDRIRQLAAEMGCYIPSSDEAE